MAVGAPFAVLLAEELFASGCQILLSITSAGQLTPLGTPPYFVFIEKALRDDGTSAHYLPPDAWSRPLPTMDRLMDQALVGLSFPVHRGASWTTDAPFRETPSSIAAAKALGAQIVEMEAAALYAFSGATSSPLLCFAQVTNQMARQAGDFEKGEMNGTVGLRALIAVVAAWWIQSSRE